MEKFKFYAPTKVYFGKDEEQRVGKILQEYHPKKVLIHYVIMEGKVPFNPVFWIE